MEINTGKPVRDREATRTRLIEAVGRVIARKGFKAVGVNAIAREAGVDKVLIYRYFNGLPGLIAAFGSTGDFWPGATELAGGNLDEFMHLPIPDRLSQMAGNYLEAILRRPLTQEIMAWEMVERNELTVLLEDIREHSFNEFFKTVMKDSRPGADIQAMAAIVGAAINYLVTRSRNTRWFGGIDLASDDGWRRLMGAVEAMARTVAAG